MVGVNRLVPFAALLVLSPFAAQADGLVTHAFTSVTGIEYGLDSFGALSLSIVGVSADTAAPATVTFPVGGSTTNQIQSACTGFASQMMSTPGVYTLTFVLKTTTTSNPGPGGGTITSTGLSDCRLDRNP